MEQRRRELLTTALASARVLSAGAGRADAIRLGFTYVVLRPDVPPDYLGTGQDR